MMIVPEEPLPAGIQSGVGGVAGGDELKHGVPNKLLELYQYPELRPVVLPVGG